MRFPACFIFLDIMWGFSAISAISAVF